MLASLALLALVALLGLAAFGVMAGAVVAVIAAPGDLPVELPPRAAGISLVSISLLVFVQTSIIIAGHVA